MYYDDDFTTGGYGENNEGQDDAAGVDINETAGQTQEEQSEPSNLEYTGQVEVNEARERAERSAQQETQSDSMYRYTRVPYGEEHVDGAYGQGGYGNARDGYGNTQGGYDQSSYGNAQGGYGRSGYGNAQGGYGQNGYGNAQDGYGQNGYGNAQSGYGQSSYNNAQGGYGQNDYGDVQYADVQDAPKKEKKPRKKKKKPGKGAYVLKFIGKAVAAAVIFGIVAALVFNGTNFLLGSSSTTSSSSSGSSSLTDALVSSASGDATSSVSVGTATALDVSDVVENVMPSIVSVTSLYSYTESYSFGMEDSSSTYSSVGSGIIVAQTDETLYIATNNHVVEDADSVSVTFTDDAEVAAEIKGTDSTNDLAVLSVSISDMSSDTLSSVKVATLGDSDELEVGETTIAIGNALGYGQSVTTGIVSALNREVTIDNVTSLLIQTDAAINPGNSGGALLNAAGEVIGINSAKYADTDVEGMGYAIPINTAIPIINELIEKEKVSDDEASYLGIAGVDVTDEVSSYYSMPTGVYISQVMSGSAAEEAGIQAGDILTSFDGKTISTMEELQSLMEYYAGGTTVEVVVQRANNGVYEEISLSVTLGYKNQ